MLTCFFAALAVRCRHFDWLDNLREHIAVDEIIRVQVMSERDGGKGDLECCSVMEECKRELSCVCIKMAEAVGWQPGRPYRPHAPKPGEQRQKAMRIGRAGPYLFTLSDEDSDEDAPEGRRARVSDPWLAPVRDVPLAKNPSTGTAQQRLFLVLKLVLHAVVVISEVLRLNTKSRCSRCYKAHL